MKILLIAIMVIVAGLVLWWQLGKETPKQVTNFKECVAAGNPVMESYPRQCRHGDQTFVEELTPSLSQQEALAIAGETKECLMAGVLTDKIVYNENSRTWWIDLERMPELEKDGCNPACVVSEDAKTAEVNWRCTGLIPSNEPASETIRELFAEKYPKYAKTVSVSIEKETQDHARGSVIFEAGAPGGIFLAAKIDGKWQIVFDGNGQIPCNLSKYGFPNEMLSDCAE